MRMSMKKRRMRCGRRQATYAKLCRVAKLHPARPRASPLPPALAAADAVHCIHAREARVRRRRTFRPHQETAMDPDPHPRGAIATLPPASPFSRLPGPAAKTSAHPQG